MKNDYRLLLLGAFNSIFVRDFIIHLKKVNPDAHIYYWGPKSQYPDRDNLNILNFLDSSYFYEDKSFLRRRYFRYILDFYLCRKNFIKFTSSKHFDVVCINFVQYSHSFILDHINKCSSNLVVAPWGSDVLRVGRLEKMMQSLVYKASDYVKGPQGKFTEIVKKQYRVPDEKLVSLHLGSSLIDYILENKKSTSADLAKNKLGIENNYVITCGYNANPAQNHLAILESINKIKDKLPKNLMLLFPFTYGSIPTYIESVKNKVCELGLNAIYFEEFLDTPKLFLLRQATDIFIHIQSSDSFSASIREYLLCEKKVINGAWLKYSDLEEDGIIPYFITKDVSTLSETILKAYQSEPLQISDKAYNTIVQMGWSVINDWNNLFVRIS